MHDTTPALRARCTRTFEVDGKDVAFVSLPALADICNAALGDLPFSIRILVENLLRHCDRPDVGEELPRRIMGNYRCRIGVDTVPLMVARVLAQDVSGIPSLIDLATMRDAMASAGGDPARINPRIPVELIVDHSLEVDHAGKPGALDLNVALEYQRNRERYTFLKWAQGAFDNLSIIPPGAGILHQINLEHLARVVCIDESQSPPFAYPDTLVGTDSHTGMVNSIGVLGWGVGGIEAEAAMLGEPLPFVLPPTVGVRLLNRPAPGITAADIVLTLTQLLREAKVVESFVEFTGPALDSDALSLEDRATLANMSPEYGATCGFFPVDAMTLDYLVRSGRSPARVRLVEAYCRAQGLWRDTTTGEPAFSRVIELDLATVRPSAAGPRRPHERVPLDQVPSSFLSACPAAADSCATVGDPTATAGDSTGRVDRRLDHGSVVLAAITSCTNTSNPKAMIAAGLVARKARALGLTVPKWVKTSLTPGSRVVSDYLQASGLQDDLDSLGFHLAGFGCASCGGGSGPLSEQVRKTVEDRALTVSAVLSGNRNFEGRIHPLARANYLVSPPLVVVYAIAGSVRIDLTREAVAITPDGEAVRLEALWPSNEEVAAIERQFVKPSLFLSRYADITKGDAAWQRLPAGDRTIYQWDESSTYVRRPPYVDEQPAGAMGSIIGGRPLLILGDSVTTDNISPADGIRPGTPAADYLRSRGVQDSALHTFIARRGNHEVMMRGTFTGGRLFNEMHPQGPPGSTMLLPENESVSIYEAAMRQQQRGIPVVVVAGKEYGTGSSRDWAAKGTRLLGVRAVLAESFERIHRSNLVNTGVLPLQFEPGVTRLTLGIDAQSRFDIDLPDVMTALQWIDCVITNGARSKTIRLQARLNTDREIAIWRRGGILPAMMDALLAL